jgi:hypothetical protein
MRPKAAPAEGAPEEANIAGKRIPVNIVSFDV